MPQHGLVEIVEPGFGRGDLRARDVRRRQNSQTRRLSACTLRWPSVSISSGLLKVIDGISSCSSWLWPGASGSDHSTASPACLVVPRFPAEEITESPPGLRNAIDAAVFKRQPLGLVGL